MIYNRIKSSVILLIGVATFSFLGSSCNKDSGDTKTTTYNVRMTDAPGDYQEVNIDIIGVEVHSDEKGWVSLSTKTGVYNLLKFTNGLDTLLASGPVAVGTVSQIRFILGPNNSVKVNDSIYPLSTPSADQSGLKLQVHSELVEGITYSITIDFDADKSIVQTGKGAYKLKPVLRSIVTPLTGAIKGTISPLAAHPAIMAIKGTDTFSTYSDLVTGKYLVQGLNAGTYKVVFFPKAPFSDSAITGVVVVTGLVTDMGNITLK